MSHISNLKPLCMVGSITNPAVLNGSANILKIGRLKAPGSVLSIINAIRGSPVRSVNSSSVAPGPIPRMFPENESFNISWPAPYSFKTLATSVHAVKIFHASSWTSGSFSPLACPISSSRSSPHAITLKSATIPVLTASLSISSAFSQSCG